MPRYHPLGEAIGLKLALRARGRAAIAFDLPSLGEWQFIGPVVERFAQRHPRTPIVIVHHRDTLADIDELGALRQLNCLHVRRRSLDLCAWPEISVFLTSEQYDRGVESVYSVAMFHGQAAKGLSFTPEIIATFDGLFLNGPIHREAFDLFVTDFLGGSPPAGLDLYEIGYPKSDALLNGAFNGREVAKALSLTEASTVLYAPAFNDGASLREFGLEIIEVLSADERLNLLVKLPIDCWEDVSNIYATGGVDWFARIRELEASRPNLRLYTDYQIDPLLACADVLVTCISSVGFEFMALGKPVVFIDTPRYFEGYLKEKFPQLDVSDWANRSTVNGGKEFGLTVARVRDLPRAVGTVLKSPECFPRQREKLETYLLYNRGQATDAAVAQLAELIERAPKPRRRTDRVGLRSVIASRVRSKARALLDRLLAKAGYRLTRIDHTFIDTRTTVAEARAAGMSVCDYRESREDDPRKVGRRDRIIAKLRELGVLDHLSRVCEIGPGTGMYLEKVIETARPAAYEFYEIHDGWAAYLEEEYGRRPGCELIRRPADGVSLAATADGSCDLVHAHAVFVYIPLLRVLAYLKECVRVCRPGGHIVFDCFPEAGFATLAAAEAWLKGPHRFPVVIPRRLLEEFAAAHDLTPVAEFAEVYGGGASDYFVWRKGEAAA